jgi:hypothetical protein
MLDILGGIIAGIPGKAGAIATAVFLLVCALIVGLVLVTR